MANSQPEIRAKFDSPDFVENNEAMLKEEFSKYFQVRNPAQPSHRRIVTFIVLYQIIEDIVDTIEGQALTKSDDYTGFKKFLLGCLESLDIDVSRFMGELSIFSLSL